MKPKIFIASLLIIFAFSKLEAQLLSNSELVLYKQPKSETEQIFNNIYMGLINNNISQITKHIKRDVSLKLKNGVSDYFSPSQAFYVLKDFLNNYQLIELNILTIQTSTDFPYVSGTAKFKKNGVNGTLQVFYSLKKIGSGWTIAQLTMN